MRTSATAGAVKAVDEAAGMATRRATLAPPAEGGTRAAKEKGLTAPALGMRMTIGKATKVAEAHRKTTTSDALRAVQAEAIATEIGVSVGDASACGADHSQARGTRKTCIRSADRIDEIRSGTKLNPSCWA
jgi:hypothetical protein